MTTNLNQVAEQAGTTPEVLQAKVSEVLAENDQAWSASGKTSEQKETLAVRVAARQLMQSNRKLLSSGCVNYEGMFITSPPYKDWARLAYRKLSRQMDELGSDAVDALITQGVVVTYTPNGEGTWNRKANPSLINKQAFENGLREDTVYEIPKRAQAHGETGTYFYAVWDKNNPTFAKTGQANFRYGAPRPDSEPERKCLFFGRKTGDADWSLLTVTFSGDLAKPQQKTYTPGVIALYPGRSGEVAYGKADISRFTVAPALASEFPAPPLVLEESGPTGIVADILGDRLLPSFDDLRTYYDTHNEDDDWWDQWVGVIGEVAHIDLADNGGYELVVGDLDILSKANTITVKVSREHADSVDFGVGSQILVVGAVWQNRENEINFTTHGWYPTDVIGAITVSDDDDGWDES